MFLYSEPTQEKGDEQSEFFTRIDMLLEGTTAEQHQAYNILCANMSKVIIYSIRVCIKSVLAHLCLHF